MGTALNVSLAVLTALGACRQGPAQTATGAEPLTAQPGPAPFSSSAASAAPLAASSPVIEQDAHAEAASTTVVSPAADVTFEGARLIMSVVGGRCALTFKGGDTVRLDLAPPCHVLIWNEQPPRLTHARPESDGEPVGQKGDAMAWKYPSAHDANVLAVIGDSVADRLRDDSVLKIRQEKGYRCAGSLQGVKVVKGKAMATARRYQVGIFCVETGIDEKDYWMLAHDKQR